VRDTGGTVVALNWTMENIFDISRGDVWFSASDIGWVVGHSFIVYGPLIRGGTSVLFEGKPIVPNPGILWKTVEALKVKAIYLAPTAVRVVKKEDFEGEYVKKHDLSSLKSFHLVGERCDPDTIWWVHKHFPQCIINDNWWQTETGWPISSNFTNLRVFKTVLPTLPGSVTRPVPGYKVQIVDDHNEILTVPNTLGRVVIKLPLPPSFMATLWGNDEAFIKKYLSDTPGYYTTGDAGLLDERGYLHIMTRVDDVINTAGHRLSTGRLEEVINEHPRVVESAVVGYYDEIRGDCPVAFVILRGKDAQLDSAAQALLSKEINEKVRSDVGPIARLEGVIFVERLPKTRSGKILRGTIRKYINGETDVKMPATIDDPATVDSIREHAQKWLEAMNKQTKQ
jgi:propionyl-CoA synthetase